MIMSFDEINKRNNSNDKSDGEKKAEKKKKKKDKKKKKGGNEGQVMESTPSKNKGTSKKKFHQLTIEDTFNIDIERLKKENISLISNWNEHKVNS
jgi:hypothetical protein